jgi:Fic family protein
MLKLNDLSDRQARLLTVISDGEAHLASEIIDLLRQLASPASIKRDLRALKEAGVIEQFGKARATAYRRSTPFKFLGPVDLQKYFSKTQDERGDSIRFNFDIFSQLSRLELFTVSEKRKLSSLLNTFRRNVAALQPDLVKREIERVTIDLSWKSSAIEGNTYSLLETETLIKEGIPAAGKSTEETTMVVNHKVALDFVRNHRDEFSPLSINKIETVHDLLSRNLNISRSLRKRVVGIIGTNYKPLDNEFQIREALDETCRLINESENTFVKTLLALLLISYIQPFEDGNKRTARLIGNAILLSRECFPLSFRSVDATHFKKSLLLFYETNNLSEFKNLFLEQSNFSVNEYFR